MSESINALATALAKAQSQMGAAIKDAVNPHLKSKYADLASVWSACREPLTANGLAVVQLFVNAPEGCVAVETRLLHSSGESLSSVCVLPVLQKTPQGIGSAITYARRYGLSALVGVVSEDDDGHAASNAKAPPTLESVKSFLGEKKKTKAADAVGDVVDWQRDAGTPVAKLTDKQLEWYRNDADKNATNNEGAEREMWAHRFAMVVAEIARRKQVTI